MDLEKQKFTVQAIRSSDINVLHGMVVINTKMRSWITIASNVPSTLRRQIWSFLMRILQWMLEIYPTITLSKEQQNVYLI